jgi:hypothetical protein
MFQILMLGALMGILGQGARAVVGLKGMSDNAQALNKKPRDLFDSTRLLTSLLIGFLVGLAAALMYIIKNDIKGGTEAANALSAIDWHVLVGFAASGYVGVDFLEGFIAQYLPTGSPGSQKPVVDQAPKPAPQGGQVLFRAAAVSSANCTDRLWLKSIVNTAVTDWMVAARKIAAPPLDFTKKFTDFQIQLPAFLQLCNDISGPINQTLASEPCTQRLVLSVGWSLQHQSDVIATFVDAVVEQILNPPAAGV